MVYVIVKVPDPAVPGQNVFPTTPVPDHVPPNGVPANGAQGASAQNGPTNVILGNTSRMNTSRMTGALTQPSALVAKTLMAFVINPGAAVDQSTLMELVPCPDVNTPGAATVHV